MGDVIGEMVNRFLSWPLPGDVCVDAVACQKGAQHRTGTNLLTHAQARQMIEHVCAAALAAKDAEIERLRTGDTCARACEGMAFRIMYQQEKARAERAEKAEAELAALRAELAVLRNNQLGPVPDGPLKALGAWVADHTDDDTWPNAERYLNAALAEMEALRERVARLVGAIEPVAKVHINRTGGNVGIAWRAIGIDGSLPALADGEVLYVLRTALESVNSLLEGK